jgi:hypothetical protein
MNHYLTIRMVLVFPLCMLARQGLAVDYPPDPVAPRSAYDCNLLAREYRALRTELIERHEEIGDGRGPQVNAGPCCMSAPGSTRQWCRTYESHAAAWEAIHCVDIERERAVSLCREKVVQWQGDRPPPTWPTTDRDADFGRNIANSSGRATFHPHPQSAP